MYVCLIYGYVCMNVCTLSCTYSPSSGNLCCFHLGAPDYAVNMYIQISLDLAFSFSIHPADCAVL